LDFWGYIAEVKNKVSDKMQENVKKESKNWDVKHGDYQRDSEYDKLYLHNRKVERTKKSALVISAGILLTVIFYFILKAASSI
jgi:hypothetical protein